MRTQNLTPFIVKPMKKFSAPIILTTLIVLGSLYSFGQRNSFDRWYVDVNVGPTVFIGDIRSADFIPSFESPVEIGYAFGAVFGKEMGDYFNIRSQFVYGRVNGVKPVSDFEFKTNFFSAGLGLELNLNQLFTNDNRSDLHVFGTFGASYLMWNADLSKASTSVLVTNDKAGSIAIPIGLKLSYELSPKLYLNLEGSLFVVTSDMVDAKSGGIAHDDINYNYIGLTYKFDKKKRRRKPISRSRIVQATPAEPDVKEEVAKVEEEKVEEAIIEVDPEEKSVEVKEELIAEAETKTEAKIEEAIISKVIKQENTGEAIGIKGISVDYRVSVYSNKTKTDPVALQKQLRIPEKIVEKMSADGTYCYLVGNFDKMWKAKELRNKLITQSNVKSAKVVLCKDDKAMHLIDAYNFAVAAQKNTVDEKLFENSIYELVELKHTVPETGLSFGVQILSVKKEVYPIQVIIDLYDIKGNVIVDRKTSWSKFIVDGYETLEDAVKDKFELRKKGFTDAFIVAYYNGRRIPPSKIKEYLNK